MRPKGEPVGSSKVKLPDGEVTLVSWSGRGWTRGLAGRDCVRRVLLSDGGARDALLIFEVMELMPSLGSSDVGTANEDSEAERGLWCRGLLLSASTLLGASATVIILNPRLDPVLAGKNIVVRPCFFEIVVPLGWYSDEHPES